MQRKSGLSCLLFNTFVFKTPNNVLNAGYQNPMFNLKLSWVTLPAALCRLFALCMLNTSGMLTTKGVIN